MNIAAFTKFIKERTFLSVHCQTEIKDVNESLKGVGEAHK